LGAGFELERLVEDMMVATKRKDGYVALNEEDH
jgi:hypothetical protein